MRPINRVLLVSNARAGSVSARTKEVIAKALAADFKLEVADTTARNHASELAGDAVDRDFDAVIVFGGDGTVNEVVQGLAGTDVVLGIIPGGTTNVMARSLGFPRSAVDATAYLAARLRSGSGRIVNLGRIGSRFFLFSSGMGLDAAVVRAIERRNQAGEKWNEWTYFKQAIKTAMTEYRGQEPQIELSIGDERHKLLLAICGNARPFTYFKRFPVDACPEARLDGGLDVLGLTKLGVPTVPRIIWSVFVSRSHTRWRSTRYYHDVESALLTAARPMPMEADGDYIGEADRAELTLVRNALTIAA